jgi:purine-binding chemotaxis protein CheW
MMRAPPRSLLREDPASQTVDYVTIIVAAQRFGLPIACVHDVFMAGAITPVPLAPPEVSGLLNLRGRVVTALSMRRLLRLPDLPPGEDRMVVGVEHAGESFGLVVDSVGEVVSLSLADQQPNPINLDPRWARISRGIHWLDDGLLVIVDIDAALGPTTLGDSAVRSAPAHAKGMLP